MISDSAQPAPDDGAEDAGRTRYACVGAALFLLVGLIRIWMHEPWRDECNPWVIGLDCRSLGDLYRCIKYEGHTYYLFVLAWSLAQFFETFFVMQALHVVAATITGFLLLRYAPWPKWEAALCLCGYFLSYEYVILCRPYVGAVLGVVLIAMAWGKRADRPWLGGTGVFVLSQTSIFGVILVLALSTALAVVARQRRSDRTLTVGWCAGWFAPLVCGVVLSLLMLVPPANSDPTNDWYFRFDPERAYELGTRFWHVFVPLPNVSTSFPWNSNIIEIYGIHTGAMLGVMAVATALWFLRHDLAPFLFFLIASTGVGAFCYLKYFGWPRHHGHLLLALLLSFWIVSTSRRSCTPAAINWFRRALFAVQAVAGFWLSVVDIREPFSANEAAAKHIASGDFAEHLIVSHGNPAIAGLVMHVRRPIYHLNREKNRWGTFVIWDRNEYRCQLNRPADVFRSAAVVGDEYGKPVLLVLNNDPAPMEGFRRVASFNNSMIGSERFFLYTRDPFAARFHRSDEVERLSNAPEDVTRR